MLPETKPPTVSVITSPVHYVISFSFLALQIFEDLMNFVTLQTRTEYGNKA